MKKEMEGNDSLCDWLLLLFLLDNNGWAEQMSSMYVAQRNLKKAFAIGE
jgi:hypothetical protein